MKFLSIAGALAFTAALSQSNSTIKLCDFAPENTVRIAIEDVTDGSGIDQDTYNAAIDQVEAVYAPLVKAAGGTLKMNRMWTTNDVNSSANQSGGIWNINAYGGLARYPIMTKDAEIMVLCHEMGHHLGGFPEVKGIFGSKSWASNEGQADYFATMKCFRRVMQDEDNIAVMTNANLPKEVVDGCRLGLTDAKEIALCERSAVTGKILAEVLYELGHQSSGGGEPDTKPDFGTPTTTTVAKTNDAHPKAQCRLDTYFQGGLCAVAADSDFSRAEPKAGACSQEAGDKYGFRPDCWYKPQTH